MRIVLEVIDGPRKGDSFTFDSHAVVLMGRSDRCGAYSVGNDPLASRVHLIMEINPPLCRIRDLGSRNYTYVDGARVTEAEVGDGGVVQLGATKLVVHLEQSDLDQVMEGEEAVEELEATSSSNFTLDSEEEFEPIEKVCVRCGTDMPLACGVGLHDAPVCDECRAAMKSGGETVPGYRIIREIVRGGMGVVSEAEDTRTGRRVAVKTMIPDIAASTRMVLMFLRESRISLGLKHPSIVEFIAAGQYDGQLYVVMEYVDGVNAEEVRKALGGRIPAGDVVTIALQALEAMSYAHAQGVVHRDIKPGNILLIGSPGNYQVKLADFGLARNYRSAGMSGITHQGEVRGSIPYMSREQVMSPRDADGRTDLFGLGATMYHLLTGEFIYAFRSSEDPLVTIMETEPVPIGKRATPVDAPLAAVIEKAIRIDPNDRFQSAEEMREALTSAASHSA